MEAQELYSDTRMRPKSPHFTVLDWKEEAICITFCKHTLLLLDDRLHFLQ